MSGPRSSGSKYLYEPFDAAAARIESNERVNAERWAGLEQRLKTIEASLERLERRLWLALYGAVAVGLTRGIQALLDFTTN